jgi:putative peptidoglycan lipid II flippase
VSRGTGVARLALVAAVLGPTYLGNTFQATNQIPTLTYQVLIGSLLSSLLVPPLVRAIDTSEPGEVERLAGSLLGLAMAVFAVSSLLLLLAGPVLLRVLSAGVEDPGIASAQRRTGWILLLATAPQVVLYGVASVGEAALFARDRFSLAAAAPSLENVGLIVTLVLAAAVFGTGVDVDTVRTSELLLLGVGSTVAVAVHALAKWGGAWRAGIRLVPNTHWRTPEVRQVVRRAGPTIGYAVLTTLLQFLVVVVANSVAGGVVAFQVGLQLMYFPVALAARSVSVTLLPVLSRLAAVRDLQRFRDELARGLSLALFVVLPAAVFYLGMAGPIASSFAFGEMATPRGVTLLTVATGALAIGVLGEAVFVISTLASYARDDTRSPFDAMVVRAGVTVVPAVVALTVLDGAAVIFLLGLAISAGNAAGAWHLGRRLRKWLPRTGGPVVSPALRAAGAALLMVVPARAVVVLTDELLDGGWKHGVGLALAGATAAGVYLLAHRRWRSPELRSWVSSLRSSDQGAC